MSKNGKSEIPSPRTEADILHLVHELQVHQIELEIQNEELRVHQIELDMQNGELERTREATETVIQQYADLYDFAPVGYFTLARDSTIHKTNFAGSNLLSLTRGELINRRFGMFVTAEARPAFNDCLERAFASRQKETCEVTLEKKDGAFPLWVHIMATLESGQKCRVVVSDITELKRAEHQAGERVKELQAFYSLAEITEREAITLDGIYQELADVLPNSWQYPEITCARIVMGNSEFRTKNFADSAWMQSAPVKVNGAVMGKIEIGYLENKLKENEGSFLKEERLLLEAIAERLGRITEHKRAEQALQDSELFVKGVLNSLTAHIAVLNEQGVIVTVNDAWMNFARENDNPDSAGFVGENYRTACEVAIQQGDLIALQVDQSIRAVLDGSQSYFSAEYPCHSPTQQYWFTITVLPQHKPRRGAIVVHQDITERKRMEEALRLSELELKEAQAVAHIGNWKWDIKKAEVTWSDEMYRIFGIDKNSYTGRLGDVIRKVIHPEDLHIVLPSNARVFVEKKPVEYRILLPDGSMRHVWAKSGDAVVDDEGNPIFLTGIAQDITEHKRLEDELRESQSILQAAMDQSSAGIAIADAPDGILRYVNDAGLLIRGGDRQSIVNGIGINQYVATWQTLNLDGTPLKPDEVPLARAIMFGEINSREVIVRRTSDDDRIVLANAAPIMDEAGKVTAGIVVFTDITERKQMEEALRESDAMFQALFEFAPDAIVSTDHEGNIMRVNAQAEVLFGYRREELNGQPIEVLMPERFTHLHVKHRAEYIVNSYARAMGAGLDAHGRRKDGSEFPIDISLGTLETGSHRRILCSIRNITERKQVENQLRVTTEALEAANLKLQIALTREKQFASTDVLTGINNRRHLFELAEREFEIAARYQHPLSVMMFDIDHFKQVNDTYGHAAGDQILQRVTEVACAELRSADVIGRYGGEEFVVVLPMTTAQHAYPLAERIRTEVAALRVPTERGDASVTLSIGIVEIIHDVQTDSAENLIRRADKAMYAAKQAGRNLTEIGK